MGIQSNVIHKTCLAIELRFKNISLLTASCYRKNRLAADYKGLVDYQFGKRNTNKVSGIRDGFGILVERVFAGVVGRSCGHRLPIRRMDLTESKVRKFILELQPAFVLFQELPALVPYVQQYDLIPSNTISHSGTIATIAKKAKGRTKH